MNERDKRQSEFDVLRESIRLGWREMESASLTPDERVELRNRVLALVAELSRLIGGQQK
jgi:hypothetical protein